MYHQSLAASCGRHTVHLRLFWQYLEGVEEQLGESVALIILYVNGRLTVIARAEKCELGSKEGIADGESREI